MVRGIEGGAVARYFGLFALLWVRKAVFLLTGIIAVCPEMGRIRCCRLYTAFWTRTSAAHCKTWE